MRRYRTPLKRKASKRWVANVPNDPQAAALLQAEQGYNVAPGGPRPPVVPIP